MAGLHHGIILGKRKENQSVGDRRKEGKLKDI
jgi:hypothetical protein